MEILSFSSDGKWAGRPWVSFPQMLMEPWPFKASEAERKGVIMDTRNLHSNAIPHQLQALHPILRPELLSLPSMSDKLSTFPVHWGPCAAQSSVEAVAQAWSSQLRLQVVPCGPLQWGRCCQLCLGGCLAELRLLLVGDSAPGKGQQSPSTQDEPDTGLSAFTHLILNNL